MPKNIKGLSTPEEFEKIVVNGFLKTPNMLCLDWGDINKFCQRHGVFDAIRIESSYETFDDDLTNGIKRLIDAHDGQDIKNIIFQFAINKDGKFPPKMVNSVGKNLGKLNEHVNLLWGVVLSPKDMKTECGIYIIANFK